MFKKTTLSCLFFVGSLLPVYAATPQPVDLLISQSVSPTPIIDDLHYLTDTIGGRPTGSLAMKKALQWGLEQFKKAGLREAYLQGYTASRNWLPGVEKGEVITKQTNQPPLRLVAMPFSASTPEQGLKADVFAIATPSAQEIKKHAAQIKGRWLLVQTAPMHNIGDLFKEYLATPPVFKAAEEVKAAGLLWMSNREGKLLYRHNATLDANIAAIPAALIDRESGERIVRLLNAKEPVAVKATLINTVQEKPVNHNVVAEIKGREKPNEVIILGAHLDSWDLGQGALDNGCNVAMVIDVARQMMTLVNQGYKPRRTIRFMLYSGEELGLYGSWFDVKDHPKAMDQIKAVLIYDLGSGRTSGFSLGGRKDMATIVSEALKPVAGFGPFTQTTDAFIGTDNFDYLLSGIPTLVANQDSAPYLPSYHAESDSFDKVDQRELKLNTAIAAVLTWNLANTNTLPARQTQAEIKQLLQMTGLDKEMKIYNVWESFLKHERG